MTNDSWQEITKGRAASEIFKCILDNHTAHRRVQNINVRVLTTPLKTISQQYGKKPEYCRILFTLNYPLIVFVGPLQDRVAIVCESLSEADLWRQKTEGKLHQASNHMETAPSYPEGVAISTLPLGKFLFEKQREVVIGGPKNAPVAFPDIIGCSPTMRVVEKAITDYSAVDAAVLICGESGTGKELAAKAIHLISDRMNGPFVAINAGAIPETLIEAELFGSEKGSYTDSTERRLGAFARAHGGTLFLDEITSASLETQQRLLRVLQEGAFNTIGGNKTVYVDVRVLAASNDPVEMLVQKGKFRKDLYYRVRTLRINMPPLRERGDDAKMIARFLIERLSAIHGKRITHIHEKFLKFLDAHSWEGNVRELESIILESILQNRSGMLQPDETNFHSLHIDCPENGVPKGVPDAFEVGFNEAVAQYESMLIRKALEKTDGVKSKAADMLKIKRTTLVEKAKRFEIG